MHLEQYIKHTRYLLCRTVSGLPAAAAAAAAGCTGIGSPKRI